jgi:hypothetical protein
MTHRSPQPHGCQDVHLIPPGQGGLSPGPAVQPGRPAGTGGRQACEDALPVAGAVPGWRRGWSRLSRPYKGWSPRRQSYPRPRPAAVHGDAAVSAICPPLERRDPALPIGPTRPRRAGGFGARATARPW